MACDPVRRRHHRTRTPVGRGREGPFDVDESQEEVEVVVSGRTTLCRTKPAKGSASVLRGLVNDDHDDVSVKEDEKSHKEKVPERSSLDECGTRAAKLWGLLSR